MSKRPAGTPAFAHGALEKVPPSRPFGKTAIGPLGGVGLCNLYSNLLEVRGRIPTAYQRDRIWMQN